MAASLLILYAVADLHRARTRVRADGRSFVHFGDGDVAQPVFHATDYFARRRIADLTAHARDGKFVAFLHARTTANIQHERVAGNVGNQAVDGHDGCR